MTREPRDKQFGTPLSERIRGYAARMEDIGVGLYHVVPDGNQGFDYEGAALVEYVRRSLHALLDAGAVPARFVPDGSGKGTWMVDDRYGTDKRSIVEGVIAEWLSEGGTLYPEWGDGWFMWPEYLPRRLSQRS
jgi:hypothetical protein